MRKAIVIGFSMLNLLLAYELVAAPDDGQFFPQGIFDCCQGIVCCDACCWFTRSASA